MHPDDIYARAFAAGRKEAKDEYELRIADLKAELAALRGSLREEWGVFTGSFQFFAGSAFSNRERAQQCSGELVQSGAVGVEIRHRLATDWAGIKDDAS